MEYCQKTELYLSDVNPVDSRTYGDYKVIVEGVLGLWRPVIFKSHPEDPGLLVGVCSGLVLVPTRNEAFERGKSIIDGL